MATAFIPAKSTSQRIPGKNMAFLGDKPLIGWTLEACKKWGVIDRVVVATDDPKTADYSLNNGAHEIFDISKDDTEDRRTVRILWKHYLSDQSGVHILMHPTNPFRRLKEMSQCWEMWGSGKYDIIMSVREERHLIMNRFGRNTEGPMESMTRLTQNVSPKYILDGSYYISTAEYIKGCNCFEDGVVGLFAVSKVSAIEIDEPDDLELARWVAAGVSSNMLA